MFFINSILLGIGLAMDAFSVSLANGLQDTGMPVRRRCLIASTFALFQTIMPMAGWLVVHTAVQYLHAISPLIPWVALGLLLYIGGGMVLGALKDDDGGKPLDSPLSFGVLMTQGVATSIDALSVGFTTVTYGWMQACLSSMIIGMVTFAICLIGLTIGQRLGTRLASRAELFGGIILIGIGIEIWVTGVMM